MSTQNSYDKGAQAGADAARRILGQRKDRRILDRETRAALRSLYYTPHPCDDEDDEDEFRMGWRDSVESYIGE